jgi:hypothetical protein
MVQIKGTCDYSEKDDTVKYVLRDLAFPAFICDEVTLNPGILFVVLNPTIRGNERVFWKYLSVSFLNSIDFSKGSMTISFRADDEILDDEESILQFCRRLEEIAERHSFVNQLERHSYSEAEVARIIQIRNDISNMQILRLLYRGTSGDSKSVIRYFLIILIGFLCYITT